MKSLWACPCGSVLYEASTASAVLALFLAHSSGSSGGRQPHTRLSTLDYFCQFLTIFRSFAVPKLNLQLTVNEYLK